MSTLVLRDSGVTAATLDSSQPTTNLENRVEIGENNTAVGEVTRTLIKFAGLSDGSIPAGSTITSATLALITSADRSDNQRTLSVIRVLRDWVANQATQNIYKTSNNWGTAGCSNTTTDREAADIGSTTVANNLANGSTVSISLNTAKIQEMIAGGVFVNNGFLLKVDTELDDKYEYLRPTDVTPTNRPTLTIEYNLPSGFLIFM